MLPSGDEEVDIGPGVEQIPAADDGGRKVAAGPAAVAAAVVMRIRIHTLATTTKTHSIAQLLLRIHSHYHSGLRCRSSPPV